MGQVLQPQDLLTMIQDLQRQLNAVAAKVGINSAVLNQGLSIKTADSGARVDIGSGHVSIVGDVSIEDAPDLTFRSGDGTESFIRFQAYEDAFVGGTVLDIASVEDDGLGTINGSRVQLSRDSTVMIYHPDGGEEMFIGISWPYTGVFKFQGKWPNFWVPNPLDALYTGQASGVSNSSYALTYGATMASTMIPIITVEDNPATMYAVLVTASSTSGFTATFGATTNGAYNLNFWVFRV